MAYTSTVKDNVTRVLECDTVDDFLHAQGYFHYKDRALQIEMLRIIAGGRLSEILIDNEETFAIDKFMRTIGIYHYAKIEAQENDQDLLKFLTPYLNGINKAIKERTPIELKLMGHRPAPYTITDIIATIKIMSYLGLAQGQQDLEKLIIELLKGGVDVNKLKSFFKIDEEIDDGLVEKIKKIKIYEKSLDKTTQFIKALPKVSASNNWISNRNGHVLMACDPHLEINRLPSVWYEMKATIKELDQTYVGITMPGVPCFIMGSNKAVAFSFTYGFMDQIDYFVEEIKESKIRVGSEFHKLKKRIETIHRKNHLKSEISIYETDSGLLETNIDDDNLRDGLYLSLSWSNHKSGGLETLKALKDSFQSTNAKEMADALSNVCISCNWLIGDDQNNIIYQQSGKLPLRKSGGILPLMGYKKENKWSGTLEAHKLTRFENPESGLLITANNLIDYPNEHHTQSINAPMGDYRRDRIEQEVVAQETDTLEKFKKIQHDITSLQAKKYITKFKALEELLGSWDYQYDISSKEATLFERFYTHLFINFFSDHFIDSKSSEFILTQSAFVADFYNFFDETFFGDDDSLFFSRKSRKEYVDDAIIKALLDEAKPWGEVNKLDMNNIFFDGKLPKFAGVDIKDLPIKGNRSTVSQGSIFRAHNRNASFCPSWRFVVDLKTKETYSQIPGGLSDRRFPINNYISDITNYFSENYRSNSLS